MTEEENKLLGKFFNFLKCNSFTVYNEAWNASITTIDKAITIYHCFICKDFFDDKEKLYIHAKEHLDEAKRIENLKEFL
jgi:hypothetical protein